MSKTYERREFLAELLKLPCATLLLGVVGPIKVLAEEGDDDYRASEHHFAMGVQIEKCIGCGKCVEACKIENDVPQEPYYFRTWVERYIIYADGEVSVDSPNGGIDGFPPVENGKQILRTFFVPKLCNHCENPPCVQVCPVGATFKSQDGVVLVDEDYCIGCRYCIQACPYGARFLDPRTKTADKCTFCYHRITKGSAARMCRGLPDSGPRIFGEIGKQEQSVATGSMRHEQGAGTETVSSTPNPKVFYTELDGRGAAK